MTGVEHGRHRPRWRRHAVWLPGRATHANVAEREIHGRMGAVLSTGRIGMPLADIARRGPSGLRVAV